MATMNGSARPATSVTGIWDSVSDVIEGGRVAPRPNPEVIARAKRRTYTGEYKQQILADQLHVPLDSIAVNGADTRDALPNAGTGGSNSTYSITVAAIEVAGQLNTELRRLAAERLECALEDLEPVGVGYQVRGSGGRTVATLELAAATPSAGGRVNLTYHVVQNSPVAPAGTAKAELPVP